MLLVIMTIVVICRFGMLLVIMIIVVICRCGMFFVAVVVIVLVVEDNRLDAFTGHHAHTVEIGGIDQPVEPSLELQSVDDKQVGFADGASCSRGGLIDMRISIRANERGDRNVLTPDAPHHVTENRECRDHAHRLVRLRRHGCGERQGDGSDGGIEKAPAVRHVDSLQVSRRWLGRARATRPPTGPKTTDSA